jgi:polysaccharide chain length determinant protein (PEP-CTERM system associated)
MTSDFDLRYLMSVFWRRFPVFVATAIVVFCVFAAVAVLLPAKYTASAQVIVESQAIPKSLAQSTVSTGALERIKIIERRLMTRETLLETAERFNVFPDSAAMSPTEIVNAMRENTSFQQVRLGGNRRGGGGALAFTISFSSENARTAARVANEFVTRLLEDNVRLRTTRASDTYEFFDQETERLAGEMTAIEAQIVEFKRANQDVLPESLGFRQAKLERTVQRLNVIARERRDLEEKLKILEKAKEDPSLLFSRNRPKTQNEKDLAQLEREIVLRRAILAEEHPTIRAMRVRIESLKKIIAAEQEALQAEYADADSAAGAAGVSRIEQEIELARKKLARLDEEAQDLERTVADLERSILETPNIEMALNSLQRNYADLQRQYAQARMKLSASATGEQLELKQQAERLEVIEQASVPEKPDKPNRPLILAMGVGGGFGAGLGVIVLLEMLNRAIRRPSDLVNRLDIQPLAVIPYVYTDDEVRRRRTARITLLVMFVGGAALILTLIHQFYLPLDILAERLMEKAQIEEMIDLVRRRTGL